MYENKLSVFLSHSHKDIEKVRKIRDILETLDCEPIMFFLKCLDDDNSVLEDFIKKEIAARNVFLYCKSINAENSIWVQKELEYIKCLDSSRLFIVDIEESLSINFVETLQSIIHLLKRNTVIICCSKRDIEYGNQIEKALNENGFITCFYHPQVDGIPSMKQLKSFEYVKLHDQYAGYFDSVIVPTINNLLSKGMLLILESSHLFDGDWSAYMAGKIVNWCERNKHLVVRVETNTSVTEVLEAVRSKAIQ